MSTKSCKKIADAAERCQASRAGSVNGMVLIVLVVVVAVVTTGVTVPPGEWERLRHNLPDLWEAVRALLRGEDPGHGDLVPLVRSTPPLPTPVVIPGLP